MILLMNSILNHLFKQENYAYSINIVLVFCGCYIHQHCQFFIWNIDSLCSSFHLINWFLSYWKRQVLCDVDCGKEFILCEYNRDADSYRYMYYNEMNSLQLGNLILPKWFWLAVNFNLISFMCNSSLHWHDTSLVNGVLVAPWYATFYVNFILTLVSNSTQQCRVPSTYAFVAWFLFHFAKARYSVKS